MHQVRNCEGAHCHRAYSASFSRTPVTRENLRHLLGRAASEVGLRFDFSLCMRSKRWELREELQKTTSPPQRMHLRWHWGVSFMAFFLLFSFFSYETYLLFVFQLFFVYSFKRKLPRFCVFAFAIPPSNFVGALMWRMSHIYMGLLSFECKKAYTASPETRIAEL